MDKRNIERKLYKGRYLIAVYNSNDELVDVGFNPSELGVGDRTRKSCNEVVSRGFKNRENGGRFYFIDVFEEHEDVFSAEDDDFLRFVGESEVNYNSKRVVAKSESLER